MNLQNKVKIMRDVLSLESRALAVAGERLREADVEVLEKLFKSFIGLGGSLIFCGVGKSGHIALKLSSTFSSLGLASWFLHPVEALHGDLGRMRSEDAIVFLSKSGTTKEILDILPWLKMGKERRIGLLGNVESPLASEVGWVLDCSVEREACLNNLAPTASSTVMLGMGDAMAVYYEHLVGASPEGFALNHPGGLLGKSLKMKVRDLLLGRKNVPILEKNATMKTVIIEMTRFPVGACAILDQQGRMEGMIVEGDIRRALKDSEKALSQKAFEVMNANPIRIEAEQLAYDALLLMETGEKLISVLPVVDEKKKFLGFLRFHDLLKEGFVSQAHSKK